MSDHQGDIPRQESGAQTLRRRAVRWVGAIALTAAVSLGLSFSLAIPDAAAKSRGSQRVQPIGPHYSSIVIDAESGAVLQETAADDVRHPASLTKMMTLYMVFEALDLGRLKLNARLPVSAYAASQSPTKLDLEEGDLITVRDVILGLVTKSANDAAVVAAEGLGGSEERFSRMMTQTARKLGMMRTTFQNPSGLPDPDQVTTARDLATLARALIRRFPHYYGYFSTAEFTYAGVTHANHNRLMTWYRGADGIKTGFIRASGFNLAASAVRNNRRLIGIVLGGTTATARDQHMARLLDAAFQRAQGLPATRYAAVPAAPTSLGLIPSANAAPLPIETTALDPMPPTSGGDRPYVNFLPPSSDRPATPAGSGRSANASPVVLFLHPPKTAPSDGGWGVQVGAFVSIDAAKRAAARATHAAPRALERAGIEIAPQTQSRSTLYRTRFVGLSAAQAREACRTLEHRKITCRTLTPSEVRASVQVATN